MTHTPCIDPATAVDPHHRITATTTMDTATDIGCPATAVYPCHSGAAAAGLSFSHVLSPFSWIDRA
jgi:hypothetical protein